MDTIFQPFFVGFSSKILRPEFEKVYKLYKENRVFLLSGCFNIRWLRDAMLVPTWLHFGSPNPPKSRLGGLLGRLADVLGRLVGVLGPLGTG